MASGYKIGQTIISNSSSKEDIFEGKLITKLGVQGPPGFTFRLGDSSDIQLGTYGIYEIDLTGIGYITSFTWSNNPVNDNVYVDYVYTLSSGEG